MILSLQKRHRLIWTVFAIVLPLLFVWSYLSIPTTANNPTIEDYSLLPIVHNGIENDDFRIIERKIELEFDINYQLEFIVKKPIRQAATLIFIGENEADIKDKAPIGQLFSKGNYSFPLFDPLQKNDNIYLYNPITKKVFYTIKNNSITPIQ
ncbi:MAG: hypothetical protein ACPG19_10965 [Saprospiraceae bacterium]